MTQTANRTSLRCARGVRILQLFALAATIAIPLSACAVYPEPPAAAYYGGDCCYSYYDYPGYYPYVYDPAIGFRYYGGGGGGGYRHWR